MFKSGPIGSEVAPHLFFFTIGDPFVPIWTSDAQNAKRVGLYTRVAKRVEPYSRVHVYESDYSLYNTL